MVPGSPVTTPASATGGSIFGFFDVEGTNRRSMEETQTPAKLMGPGYAVSSDLRHQGATHNSFSPLLGLGCEEGLYFGVRDEPTVVSGEKGEAWCNPSAKPVSPSHLDGVEKLKGRD